MNHRLSLMAKTMSVLAVQGLILIVLIGVTEGVLWKWYPIYLESIEVDVTQTLPGLKNKITYKRGEYGVRSTVPIPKDKPADTIRVLCLGASTTEQCTQEFPDTWCGVLERKLKEHYADRNFQVQTMSFGFGGFRASDDAYWLREHFDILQPDVVVTLLGINDLTLNGGEKYNYTDIETRLTEKPYDYILEQTTCQKYSQLYRRFVLLKRNWEMKKQLESGEIIEWHSNAIPELRKEHQGMPLVENLIRDPDPVDEFRDVVKWFIDFVKDRHAELLLLGQPVMWQADMAQEDIDLMWFSVFTPQGKVRLTGADMLKEMERYNQSQETLAHHHGVSYLDLDSQIPKTQDYYFDDCHFTDFGSVAVAESILPQLLQLTDRVVQKNGWQ